MAKSFLEKYLSDKESLEAIKEAQQDLSLLEQVLRLEIALHSAKKKTLVADSANKSLSDDQILKLCEEFVEKSRQNQLDTIDMNSKSWKKLWQDSASFAYFQEIVAALVDDNKNEISTPQYLKNIVSERLRLAEKQEQSGILIRLKDGLQLVGGYLDNVFALPEQNEAFAVRSAGVMPMADPKSGILQFYSVEEEKQKILYQVVKDSDETVMLTVKLQDFKPLPNMMKIKREGRLIYSFSIKEDFAYFPQLMPGDYIIELLNRHGQVVKSIDISLVAD